MSNDKKEIAPPKTAHPDSEAERSTKLSCYSVDNLLNYADFVSTEEERVQIAELNHFADPFVDVRRLTDICTVGSDRMTFPLVFNWVTFRQVMASFLERRGPGYRSAKNLLFAIKSLIRPAEDSFVLKDYCNKSSQGLPITVSRGYTFNEAKNHINYFGTERWRVNIGPSRALIAVYKKKPE